MIFSLALRRLLFQKKILSSSNIVLEILSKRKAFTGISTFALILPSLMVFALQGCDVEIMPHYKQAMKALRLGHAPGVWRSFSKLGYDILRIGGNSLFSELYSTFGLYNKLAFLQKSVLISLNTFYRGLYLQPVLLTY